MEKGKAYQDAAVRMIKALLASYIVTGLLLLVLALLLYKLRLSESAVNVGIIAVYVVSYKNRFPAFFWSRYCRIQIACIQLVVMFKKNLGKIGRTPWDIVRMVWKRFP